MASFAWTADTHAAAVITCMQAYIAMWLFQLVFDAIYLYSRHNNRTIQTTRRIELQEEGLFEASLFNRTLAFRSGIIKAVAPGFKTSMLPPTRPTSSPIAPLQIPP